MSAEEGPGLDPYQAKYMGGALYHDKIRAPLYYHLLFLVALCAACGGAISAAVNAGVAAALPAALSTAVLSLAWLLFSALRVSVTGDDVYVQYGIFGPKIPVRDIERCAAVDYDWKSYGGFGIRLGRDGSVAYNMMGDKGRAVEILYRKGAKTKKVLVASPGPERLVAAVQKARAEAVGGAGERVRIEVPPESKVPPERAAEDEVLAAEDAGGDDRRARQS